MTLELYYLNETDSICSNRVIVTLSEKGITDWIPHKMLLVERDQFKPEYLKLNPQGVVPTLIHNGRPIRESSLICDYLDDLHLNPALKPTDMVDRNRMREWVKLFDERGFEATAVVNFVTKFRLTVPRDVMEERWKSVPNIDRLYRQQSVIREGVDSPYVMRAIGALESIFLQMELTLGDDRPFLMGDQFTLAEANFGPFLKILEMVRFMDFWLEAYPNVRAWWDRVASRESMKQLDSFPYNAIADDSAHAWTGREMAPAFERKLKEYREAFAHTYQA